MYAEITEGKFYIVYFDDLVESIQISGVNCKKTNKWMVFGHIV